MYDPVGGYSHLEWPDLSATRLPSNAAQVAASKIPLPALEPNTNAGHFVVAAIARVIGVYFGVADLLFAVQVEEPSKVGLLRVSWTEEDSWSQLVAKIATSIVNAHAHPTTFSSVKKLLSLADHQHPCVAFVGFDHDVFQPLIDYPVSFSYNTSDSLLQLSANMNIVHPSVSNQIVSQVRELVHSAVTSPTSKLSASTTLQSDLMSASERGTDEEVAAFYSKVTRVSFAPDYLSLRASDSPSRTAVRWYPNLSLDDEEQEFKAMSFLEFDQKANQVARWLLRQGLQPEDRVAVCLERNLVYHTAVFGIMRAGGCYVPIDPDLPLERKIYIAKDANARFVLTSSGIASDDVFGPATRYFEDQPIQLEISQESADSVACMKPTGLAYLLYTSGTTGNPKGCLLTHHGLSEAILALSNAAADVKMDDIRQGRYLAVASIAFDVHLAETIVPVALGMPLLSARRAQLFENLPAYVNRLGITHLGIVPSLIEATLNAATNGSDIALRYIASGGEKMSDAILDKWANHPQVRLANFYGPSEVTIGCCARSMTSATPRANIGRAFENVSSYVVDSNMNVVIRGGVGELVVEGPLVGRGYHGRDDLTAKVFIEWPEKGRWSYRTGDLVRMMPDRTLEILGRIDTQIKLRGVRIESEGISAIVRNAVPASSTIDTLDVTTILSRHPAINVDQLVSIISWDKSISIATRKSKKPHLVSPPAGLLNAIKARCEAELPVYMRPSHILPLSWLPLNSNGKTDEKILAQFFKDLDVQTLASISSEEHTSDSRPCTDRELAVFEVLQRCVSINLDHPRHDLNVFECGLDSMSAIRFTTFLKETLNIDISASEIMKKPRLSEIASFTPSDKVPSSAEQRPSTDLQSLLRDLDLPFESTHVENVLPPFVVQEGVLARSADEDNLYVQHVLLSCQSSTDVSRLRQAWKNVVARQQILRTVFHFGRSLSQVVLRPDVCELQWTAEDITSSDPDSFKRYFLGRRADEICRNINQNISAIPPYRVSCFTTPSHVFLALSIHHSLFDGISLPTLIREVEWNYLGRRSNPVASAEQILRQIGQVNRDQARAFWTCHFEGFEWSQLKYSDAQQDDNHRHAVSFTSSLSAIKQLASSQRVTLQALLTGAFALHAARNVYKSPDVTFGVLRSGRLLPVDNVESAILPLLSIVPTRVHFKDAQTSLQSIQEDISSIVEFEHLPLGNVQSWIRPGYPLFDALFSMSVAPSSSGEIWTIIESEPPHPDYSLAVEVVIDPTEDSIRVQAAWKGHSQSEVFMEMLRDFEGTVRELGTDPATCIPRHVKGLRAMAGPTAANAVSPDVGITTGSDIVDQATVDGLRSIISDFLQVKPNILTPSLSFVSLGLDSIKSVGLAKLLSKSGFPVTSTELLQHSSLVALAKSIALKPAAQQKSISGPDVSAILVSADVVAEIRSQQNVEITDDDTVSFYPTTALQTGMLSQTINSGGKLYVHAFPMVISGELDTGRLLNAWKTAVKHFPILRTTFHFAVDSGVWVQALHTADVLDWDEVALRSSTDYAAALSSFFSTIVLDDESSFSKPPLWIRLFKPAVGEATLVFAMHHALYDGISIGLLTNAIEDIYKGSFHQEGLQFFDVLPRILAQERDGTVFWAEKLSSFRSAPLLSRHNPLDRTSVTVERDFPLDRKDVANILLKAAVTMQCICQAAWAQVLIKHTGASDVVFGHTLAGRSIPGAEFVIGPTLNTIPCCVRVPNGVRNIDFLKSIHQGNLAALPWQHASARAIQKSLGATSLWDSLFLFQSSVGAVDDTTSMWKFDEISSNQGVHIQYPLNVEILHTDSGVRFKCASQPNYLNQSELDALADDLTAFIRNLVQNPYGVVWTSSSQAESSSSPNKSNITSQAAVTESADDLVSRYGNMLAALANVPITLIKAETPLATLGVDSITAIQIVSKLKKSGLKMNTTDVLGSRTIGEMLMKASPSTIPSGKSASTRSVVAHPQRGVSDDAAASPSAVSWAVADKEKIAIYEGLDIPASTIEAISIPSPGMKWLIGSWQRSHRTRFQHVFPFQLSSGVNGEQLRIAWFSLVRRHAILRSTFTCIPGQPEPRVITLKIPAEDSWSEEHVSEETFYASLMARMKTMVANPPPLNQGQARALLFRSNRHSYLIFHLHHFQYDAWSLQSLLHDFSQLYLKKPSLVSNDLTSFLQYCIPDQNTLDVQRQYWQSAFPLSFKPALFPSLNPLAGSKRRAERLIRTKLSCIADASRLEERARSQGVSLQAVFLAAWSKIQAEFTGASSSTFGLWQSGRTGSLDNITNIAVPCMNVLPLHVQNLTTKDANAVARDIQADLYKRSSVVEQSDLVRVGDWVGAGHMPLCNVFVNIVKVGSEVKDDEMILKFAHAPYFVPDEVISQDDSTHQFEITKRMQDDLFIDIATIARTDSVMMSIDAGAHLLNEGQADALISRWASEVERVLGTSE